METKNKSAEVRGLGAFKRRSQQQRQLNSDKAATVQDQAHPQGRNRFARHITIYEFNARQLYDEGTVRGPGTKLTMSHFLDPKIEGVRGAGCTPNGWTSPQAGLTKAERKKLAAMYFAPFQNAEMRQKAERLWLQQQLLPSVADIHWDRLINLWQKYGHLRRATAGRRFYQELKRQARCEVDGRWRFFDRKARKAAEASP